MQCWFTEIQWVQIINMNKANLFQAAADTRLAGILIAFHLKPPHLEQVASSSPDQFHGLEVFLFAALTKDSSAAPVVKLRLRPRIRVGAASRRIYSELPQGISFRHGL